MTVFETFWSKTIRRTQKQEATEKSSVCLSASEFAELPSTPIFASRAQIFSQMQLCRRFYRSSYLLKSTKSKLINSGIAKKEKLSRLD